MSQKVAYVTGGMGGIGTAICQRLHKDGFKVIAGCGPTRDFNKWLDEQKALGYTFYASVGNVGDWDSTVEAFTKAKAEHGSIDVLVNNAGYGHEGILEESTLAELRHQFEVNVFGPAALIKAVLPHMRTRRRGHILNITSMGGFITLPGIAWYCGSKFALEGISEVLGKEVAPFGIHVTAVAPGSFRTDWAGRSMARAPRSIEDYDALFDPIRSAREAKSGHQLGDPVKAAQAMLQIIDSDAPPSHLLLGSDALQLVRAKLDTMAKSIDAWEQLSRSTDGVA